MGELPCPRAAGAGSAPLERGREKGMRRTTVGSQVDPLPLTVGDELLLR